MEIVEWSLSFGRFVPGTKGTSVTVEAYSMNLFFCNGFVPYGQPGSRLAILMIILLAPLSLWVGWTNSLSIQPNDLPTNPLNLLIKEFKLTKYKTDDQGHIIELRLGMRHVNDKAMDIVRQIETLQILSLGFSSVTDAGIEKLQGLPRLKEISLGSTTISDRGLSYLENIPSLDQVWVSQSEKLTERGIDSLRKAIPGIHVHVGRVTTYKNSLNP